MVSRQFKCRNIKSPLRRFIAQWVVACILTLYGFYVHSYTKKEIKNLPGKYDILMAVMKHKNNQYSTISRTTGTKKYKIAKDPKVIKIFEYGLVTLKFSTFHEFYGEIYPLAIDIKYLNKLPEKVNKYLEKLTSVNLKLDIELIIIPDDYQVFFESKRYSLSDDRQNLTFITSFKKDVENPEKSGYLFGKNLLSILPHEVFHHIDLYFSFIKTRANNSLRKETYAELFGVCISYEVYPAIIIKENKLEFPDTFFKDPKSDLKKVRKKLIKKIKQGNLHDSKLSDYLARYYFQAVANNRTGENISSDKIPKFCHKLFSEHNFKHPIEKKPPVWFKDFLAE